jgi:hypothetical protein
MQYAYIHTHKYTAYMRDKQTWIERSYTSTVDTYVDRYICIYLYVYICINNTIEITRTWQSHAPTRDGHMHAPNHVAVTCAHFVRHHPAATAPRALRTPHAPPLPPLFHLWHMGGFTSLTGDGGFSSALPSHVCSGKHGSVPSVYGDVPSALTPSALLRGSRYLWGIEHGENAPCIQACSLSHPVCVPNGTTLSACSAAIVVLRLMRRRGRQSASLAEDFAVVIFSWGPCVCAWETVKASPRSEVHLEKWYLGVVHAV